MRRKSGVAYATNHPLLVQPGRPCFSHEKQGLPTSSRMLKKAGQQGRSKRRYEDLRYRYVELLSEVRTTLADFFSILLKNHRPLRNIAERAMVTHICQE